MQQNLSSFLEHNLDPITSRYIMANYLKMDEGEQNLDLRHTCENVKFEMQMVEKEAAYDYLKVEKEMYELDHEIEKSDNILGELEGVLLNFKDYLNDIKSEMTQLQEKSVKMNTALTNRKNLSKILSSFVDQAVLDPQLIDNICQKEINEQYVEYIRILCSKLEYLNNTELTDANAVRNLGPELIKLKNTACKRVREFLIDKISQLKKPKIDVQQFQKTILIKYKIFTEFMKDHYLDIYVELCNLYTEAMSRLYLSNFKQYVAEIIKVTLDIYLRNDLIVPDHIQNFRAHLNLRNVQGLIIENRSIFQLMNRDAVLQFMDEDPILYTQLNQKNQKILVESYFKSINKLLLDTVLHEVTFSQEFFSLKPEQNRLIFSGVFKNTIQFLQDHLKQTTGSLFDLYGLLLIILLNDKNQKQMQLKGINVLDYYFEQVNMSLWPKFEIVFDTHIQSISSINVKLYRSLEKQIGFRAFVMRYVDLTLSLYKLYGYFEDNKMIVSRIYQLRLRYLDLIKRAGAEYELELDRITYTLSVYEMIVSSYNQTSMNNYKKEFNEVLYVYVLEAAIKLTGLGIEKYFEDDWNTFDFSLIVISFLSIISTNLISFFRTLKTVKSTKILKVAKLNRMFRSIKGVRSLKIFNFLLLGAESVVEFKQLISRLMLCTPQILKLIPVVISLFYLYTMIGLEFLDTANFDYNEDPEHNPFDIYHYSDFTSFGNAYLILFQICLGTSWNTIVMDYAFKFQDYLGTVLYFYSFHIISNLIILALVKGVIWEVFTIVEQNTVSEKMRIETESEINQEALEIVKERKQLYDQVMGDLEFSVECLESESSPSQKDLNNLSQTNKGFIFPPQLIPPPTTFQKPQIYKAQTCRRLIIGKSNASSQGGGVEHSISQLKRNSLGSKGQRQPKKRRTIYEKDQDDQEQCAKAERIRKRIKQLFITKEELKIVVKDQLSDMRCRREALFDSDDDESMKNYEKQISDNIQSQTKIQYFRRLQESIKNDVHFEKQKSEYQNNQIINQNYVFKRALLKDTNSDKVKKFEVDYFQSNYGQMFDGINQIDLGPLLKYEGFILHNLERAVRHKSTNYNHFVKILLQIEKNISSIMLCKGSVFKFVFQDNFSNWFYLDDFEDNIVACKTENGPWSYEDEFAHLKMYTALNYFTIEETDELCEELYLQFFNIKTMVDQYNTQFGEFTLGQSILDVLLLKYNPTEEESEKITNKSLKLIRKYIATESLPIQVNKFMIFIVMYAGDTKNQGGMQKQVKLKTLDTLKDQFITEEEKINEYVSLPLNYVVEFMDDIKNLMKNSGHKLMLKMNLFLNHSVKLKNQQKVEKVL